jgi:hypothetical protein
MAKVRFGERGRDYVQEIDMDEVVTKCDICLKEMEKIESRQLNGSLPSGLREDGPHNVRLNWKDICDDCSKELVAVLRDFKAKKNE